MPLERLGGVRVQKNLILIFRYFSMATNKLTKIAKYLISTYSISKFAEIEDEEGLFWQDKDPWESRISDKDPWESGSEEENEEEDEPWDESWEESAEDELESEKPETDLEHEFRRLQELKNFRDADMRNIRTKKDYKGEYKPWQH